MVNKQNPYYLFIYQQNRRVLFIFQRIGVKKIEEN